MRWLMPVVLVSGVLSSVVQWGVSAPGVQEEPAARFSERYEVPSGEWQDYGRGNLEYRYISNASGVGYMREYRVK